MTDTSALPTHGGVRVRAHFRHVLGREMPNPSAIGIVVWARIRRTIASAPDATWARAPVTPGAKCRREPAAERRRLTNARVGGRRAQQEIVSMPAAASVSESRQPSSIGKSSVQHASTPASAAVFVNIIQTMRSSGFRVTEHDDWVRATRVESPQSSPTQARFGPSASPGPREVMGAAATWMCRDGGEEPCKQDNDHRAFHEDTKEPEGTKKSCQDNFVSCVDASRLRDKREGHAGAAALSRIRGHVSPDW